MAVALLWQSHLFPPSTKNLSNSSKDGVLAMHTVHVQNTFCSVNQWYRMNRMYAHIVLPCFRVDIKSSSCICRDSVSTHIVSLEYLQRHISKSVPSYLGRPP